MTVIVRCDDCKKCYRVCEGRAGQRIKRKQCGAIQFSPPLDEPPKRV